MFSEQQENKSLQSAALPQDLAGSTLVLIGPKGGRSKADVQTVEQAGVEFITLGREIVRSHTIAIAAIGILHPRLGKLV